MSTHQQTLEEIKNKVFQNTLQTCEYLSGTPKDGALVTLKCIKHNIIFETKWYNVEKDYKRHKVCPICKAEARKQYYASGGKNVLCDYCGKEFRASCSDLNDSKHNFHFCCREHKDLAQRIESGEKFASLRPSHYGPTIAYRKNAFKNYLHKCAVCGWADDEDILEVHHIDSNRENNNLENLVILCPNCHRKITLGKYVLVGRDKIVLKQSLQI